MLPWACTGKIMLLTQSIDNIGWRGEKGIYGVAKTHLSAFFFPVAQVYPCTFNFLWSSMPYCFLVSVAFIRLPPGEAWTAQLDTPTVSFILSCQGGQHGSLCSPHSGLSSETLPPPRCWASDCSLRTNILQFVSLTFQLTGISLLL